MPPTYRSRPQGASGIAALVGGFLSGRQEAQDREAERKQRDQTNARLADENRRAEARFRKEMDEDGYEERSTLEDKAKRYTEQGGEMGVVVGGVLRGLDREAIKQGASWVKSKDSKSEREAKDRREREVEVAGVRAAAAREKQEDAQAHAREMEGVREQGRRELESERQRNRSDLLTQRILLGGGAGAKTAADKATERAEKRVTNDRNRYDRTMKARPEPGEEDVLDVDAQGNPTKFSTGYNERMKGWRSDSASVTNNLNRSESTLGRLLGDDDAEDSPAPAPKKPVRSADQQRNVQKQYDQAAQEFQAALARISDPKRRELARQRYEQRVKEIAAAVGDIE